MSFRKSLPHSFMRFSVYKYTIHLLLRLAALGLAERTHPSTVAWHLSWLLLIPEVKQSRQRSEILSKCRYRSARFGRHRRAVQDIGVTWHEETEKARLSRGTFLKSLCFQESLRVERAENDIGTAVMDRLTHQTSMSHKTDSGLMQIIQFSSLTISNSGLV